MIEGVSHRPRTRLDLLEQIVYLGEHTSVDDADRYLTAVEETCALLLAQPQSGVAYDLGIPKLGGLRRAPVKRFEKYWIFYLPYANGIDVVRVLHSSRDIDTVFAIEEK
jgi:toxin ParE1/3/4